MEFHRQAMKYVTTSITPDPDNDGLALSDSHARILANHLGVQVQGEDEIPAGTTDETQE